MGNFQDWSVGTGKETTYGTAVTPNRWYEFTEPKPFAPDLGVKQGAGIRAGSRVARSARRVTTVRKANGDINLEVFSKGLGLMLEACMGAGVSSLVSTGVYQQLYTFADDLTSHTVQFGVPNADGTINAITFKGSMVSSWELGGSVGEIATLKTTWDARDWDTSTAYASPTYATGGNLFTVEDATIFTGTLTAPTTTVLGSMPTTIAGVSDFKLSVDNALVADRFFANGGGLKAKPKPGTRAPKIEMKVEYGANDLRDAFLSQTPLGVVFSLVGGPLNTGTEVVQVVIPEIKLDGDLPEGGPDAIATQAIKATVLDNLTAAL